MDQCAKHVNFKHIAHQIFQICFKRRNFGRSGPNELQNVGQLKYKLFIRQLEMTWLGWFQYYSHFTWHILRYKTIFSNAQPILDNTYDQSFFVYINSDTLRCIQIIYRVELRILPEFVSGL